MLTPDNHKVKTAVISVSKKDGIIEFSKELTALGIEIYSTGGTEKSLHDAGIPVHSISELTNFPEGFDGRVKTLHPAIHAGMLAQLDNPDHVAQMEKFGFKSIDLLVVNLYPFEDKLDLDDITHEELVENIDIGGPTMLRSAAKNYRWTAPIINPNRYSQVIGTLKQNDCTIPEKLRTELAGEVFQETAYYDSLIADYFKGYNKIHTPEKYTIAMKLDQSLRYGENPHQEAALYGKFTKIFNQLHGKELSFNNIVDINGAIDLISEFEEPTIAIIKHTNPCGVGTDPNILEAWRKALATDRESPFGGIIAMNDTLTLELAQEIDEIFTEVLIAPHFDKDALELLMKKKMRRLMRVNFDKFKDFKTADLKSVSGGFLIQSPDAELYADGEMKVVTKRQPTDAEMKSLLFGWKICKHVKSNSIVYTSNDRTLAVGAGQMSRVDSSRIAVEKAKLMGLDLKGSTVASDAFFPFADGLLAAVAAGATAVIQPGGSVRDEEVIKAADENGIAMVFTGMRHFKH
jgi:phosphoribosylaminoimidazolecarboxamide formyltransferase/IMP cyclohydrolase